MYRSAARGVRATKGFESDDSSTRRRTRYRWDTERMQPIAVDTPPPPQQVVPKTHYVPYENDRFAEAHQWASEQVARKFPGAVEVLSTLDSLINQQLNADE